MKVNLAAQMLSSSVADALEYWKGKLKLPQFQGCGPTVKFIRVFDHLFDVLKSRNSLSRHRKMLNFNLPIHSSVQATADETQYRRRTRKLHSST